MNIYKIVVVLSDLLQMLELYTYDNVMGGKFRQL